ncbi:hypothetical protein [Parvibaculum sp.]|jgi:hypothetical protein|uniref:hypothetical protein n=1 Tax=Parvibaculum sp. TaxID=2024848 RepID=UPI000C939188|nr:hypothetical protein [Parvibaculum sp.]MAB13352.1 hypothetical protein [Parvibaculum sp.]
MAVALIITFETDQPDSILTQLRAYKERELDRNAPDGFISVELKEEDGKVVYRTEWADKEAMDEVTDSAPWEASLDLCDIYADDRKDEIVEL